MATGDYILIRDEEDPRLERFNKRLPCCGCGVGWCSFLLGFIFPVMWYYASTLYFCNYHRRDPRERVGLAACVFAALVFTFAAFVTVVVLLFL